MTAQEAAAAAARAVAEAEAAIAEAEEAAREAEAAEADAEAAQAFAEAAMKTLKGRQPPKMVSCKSKLRVEGSSLNCLGFVKVFYVLGFFLVAKAVLGFDYGGGNASWGLDAGE
ncbi:hypothetical protein GH714_010267 [Hevea brasiliensis]|uniref:Uncharacterized protein n=1 Tax=Hevea brasiliensis TaxID=3981 RepID=A0A6A6L201_HEVBR|nr:hypothetical protein GH714_010267 [Hevea brasiliensis]